MQAPANSSIELNSIHIVDTPTAVKELRALHATEPTLVGHYDDEAALHEYAAQLNAQGYHIYSPINTLCSEQITNLNAPPTVSNAAGDADIARRTELPYDIDSIHGKETATDEQRECARRMAEKVLAFWADRGVIARYVDSGNGFQVLLPIDLPNDAASTALVKRILEAHKAEFATEGAKLDVLFNASRIMRVVGFKNWKGDGPHRTVTLLQEASGLATREMLEAIAPAVDIQVQSAGLIASHPNNYPKAAHSKDIVERVLGYEPDWREARAPHLWIADLPEDLCPKASQHSQGNVKGTFVVTVARDGGIGAKCNHGGCADIQWVHIRAKIEEGNRRESLASDSAVLEGPDGINLTAMGNMERLLQKYGRNLKWTRGRSADSLGTFYVWGGTRWEIDINAIVRASAQGLVRSLGGLVVEAVRQNWSPEKVKAVTNFWRSSESDGMTRDIVSLLRPHVAVDRAKFDADPMLLGVQNGVVDLRDGSFREAQREDLITKQANVIFNKEAQCPIWTKFLETTTAGRSDLQRYLRQSAGICLTGLTEEHLFFIVLGPGGTGKTTFQETLKHVWGDYCCGIDPNSLAASGKPEAAKARPDLAKLPGMRLVFANESRAGMRLDEGLLKSMTGADTMTARELYQAEFDFVPTHKIWLRTNSAPLFDGGDSGMQRRVRLVPFDHVVPVKDPKLPEKLRGEAAGILNWALAGLADYQRNGLVEPAVVTESTKGYVEGLDHIRQFLDAKCELGAAFDQPSGELHATYAWWCGTEQLRPLGVKRFGAELASRGFKSRILSGRNIWAGLRLTEGQAKPAW